VSFPYTYYTLAPPTFLCHCTETSRRCDRVPAPPPPVLGLALPPPSMLLEAQLRRWRFLRYPCSSAPNSVVHRHPCRLRRPSHLRAASPNSAVRNYLSSVFVVPPLQLLFLRALAPAGAPEVDAGKHLPLAPGPALGRPPRAPEKGPESNRGKHMQQRTERIYCGSAIRPCREFSLVQFRENEAVYPGTWAFTSLTLWDFSFSIPHLECPFPLLYLFISFRLDHSLVL
jgi:hypothetical protein